MLDNINLNLLKYYYEVVTTRNIIKASQNLFVSQPAISKGIKELEKQLNTKLLDRYKTGVVPTKEGEILYDYIKDMFNNLNKTFNTIETSKKDSLHFYIGSTTTNFLEFIEVVLNKFRTIFPNVHIDITLETINILQEHAKIDKLDIIIKNDYEYINNFSPIKSFSIQDKFVASKNHFKHLINKNLSLDDILNEPLILLNNLTHGRRNFYEYLRANNKSVTPKYEFNSYSLCKELIKNGYGIGIGNPIHYIDDDFIILKTDFNLPIRKFDIGYNNNSKNKLIKEFIKLIEKELN